VTGKRNNRKTGVEGERIGESYLIKHGYKIVERNVRSPYGEVDLIASHGDTLVFIEVKARRDLSYGYPEEAVDRQKQFRLTRIASWYLSLHAKKNQAVRFDVLSVLLDNNESGIKLIQNAF